MNPLKSLRRAFKPLPGRGKRYASTVDRNDAKLSRVVFDTIWPDGTWKGDPRLGSRKENDLVVQAIMIELFFEEQQYELNERSGSEVSPGLFGGKAWVAIPDDWRPSERHLRTMWKKQQSSPAYLHYVVGELENRKVLRA